MIQLIRSRRADSWATVAIDTFIGVGSQELAGGRVTRTMVVPQCHLKRAARSHASPFIGTTVSGRAATARRATIQPPDDVVSLGETHEDRRDDESTATANIHPT